MKPIFISGIGTDVGKTCMAAVVTQALHADYWKPIQAGFDKGTDRETVYELLSNKESVCFPERYKLALPASPHISAREEGIQIEMEALIEALPKTSKPLVIEGAGGILVPINEHEFVGDIVKALDAHLILISRNYLGSINHSLLTAEWVKLHNISCLGWIFNDQFMDYEDEIVGWSGYQKLGSFPFEENFNIETVAAWAEKLRPNLLSALEKAST
jgi:dethiobiotin synthetase